VSLSLVIRLGGGINLSILMLKPVRDMASYIFFSPLPVANGTFLKNGLVEHVRRYIRPKSCLLRSTGIRQPNG